MYLLWPVNEMNATAEYLGDAINALMFAENENDFLTFCGE